VPALFVFWGLVQAVWSQLMGFYSPVLEVRPTSEPLHFANKLGVAIRVNFDVLK